MNYHNIERLIKYGTEYRREELAALIEEDTDAYGLADDICAIMLTMKSTMPAPIWEKTIDNLLKFQAENQFQLIMEANADDPGTTNRESETKEEPYSD